MLLNCRPACRMATHDENTRMSSSAAERVDADNAPDHRIFKSTVCAALGWSQLRIVMITNSAHNRITTRIEPWHGDEVATDENL